MNRKAKIVLQLIGGIAVLCAAAGFYYNAGTLAASFSGDFEPVKGEGELPYFYPAFYVMSAICLGCYALLLAFGVQFLRGRTARSSQFAALLVFEVVYFFGIGILWTIPSLARSVGGATGVANGGLMAQFIIVFPLWAPPVACWAARHLNRAAEGGGGGAGARALVGSV